MRVSRSVAAVALGSVLALTGCADGGEDDEGVDTSIEGGQEGDDSDGEDGEDD